MHPSRAYALHSLFFNLSYGLTATIYAPFLLNAGLTLAQVPLVGAFFFASITLMELPTGMLADGRSRLLSMRLGTLINALAHFGYATASGFWSAVSWEVLAGLGNAFLSGANTAWLADALNKRGEGNSLRGALAMASGLGMTSMVVGGIIGAQVGARSMTLVWIIAALSQVAALAVSLRLMNDVGEPDKRLTEKQALVASLRALRLTPSLRWVVVACLIFAPVLSFNSYWTPFFKQRVGPTGLGWVWALIYSSCAASGFAVRAWKNKCLTDGLVIPLCLAAAGVGMVGAGYASVLAAQLGFIVLHEFGRGALNPLTDAYAQARIESQYRATFGSLMSLIARGGYVFVLAGLWTVGTLLGDRPDSISAAWIGSGLLMTGLAAILWLFRPRK